MNINKYILFNNQITIIYKFFLHRNIPNIYYILLFNRLYDTYYLFLIL